MTIDVSSLPDDPVLLKKLLLEERKKYARLEERFRLAQHKQFGKSSEGYPGQGELFNEAEELSAELEVDKEAPETEQISYERKKPVRKSLPIDLPREVVVHDIAEEDKVCDGCGYELHQMGEDKSEKLGSYLLKLKWLSMFALSIAVVIANSVPLA